MGDFPHHRVLIVDDDRDFAAALSAILTDRGYIVETANDGAAAGEALGRFAADAALIGLRPTGGDGPLEPMAEMRRRQPDMVCVMVTDVAEIDTLLEAWRAGADDCLSKPIDPPLLFATLERCIANRKRLNDSEQRFRDITEASSDWFWEMDEDLRFSYFSDRFSEVTGVPHDSLLGKTREETGIPEVDAEAWQAHLADLAAHRSFRNFHHARTRPDGSLVHLSINGKAIFDAAGKFLGYRGAGSDITEHKMAEERLKQAHDELERRVEERTGDLLDTNTRLVQEIVERTRAEAELRVIFDESPIGVWQSDWSAVKRLVDDLSDRGVTDWRGFFTEHPARLSEAYDLIKLVSVSRAVLGLYGVADTASLAKIYRADTVPEDNLYGFRDALLSFIDGHMTALYEARERRADGAEIVTRNTLTVPVDFCHDWSRVLYSVEDITDRRRAQKRSASVRRATAKSSMSRRSESGRKTGRTPSACSMTWWPAGLWNYVNIFMTILTG